MSDFLHPEGKASLYREEAPIRQDSSILSSLYSYWLLSNDQSGKALTPSEIKARKTALKCIQVWGCTCIDVVHACLDKYVFANVYNDLQSLSASL